MLLRPAAGHVYFLAGSMLRHMADILNIDIVSFRVHYNVWTHFTAAVLQLPAGWSGTLLPRAPLTRVGTPRVEK